MSFREVRKFGTAVPLVAALAALLVVGQSGRSWGARRFDLREIAQVLAERAERAGIGTALLPQVRAAVHEPPSFAPAGVAGSGKWRLGVLGDALRKRGGTAECVGVEHRAAASSVVVRIEGTNAGRLFSDAYVVEVDPDDPRAIKIGKMGKDSRREWDIAKAAAGRDAVAEGEGGLSRGAVPGSINVTQVFPRVDRRSGTRSVGLLLLGLDVRPNEWTGKHRVVNRRTGEPVDLIRSPDRRRPRK